MAKNPAHRPTIFTEALAVAICKRIATGESVRSIVKDPKMPSSSTIFKWLLDKDKKEFAEQYEKARNEQAEMMFEELLEIADQKDKDVMRARLRVDTRKWYLSKVLPKKFGDKLDVTTGGEKIIPIYAGKSLQGYDSNAKDLQPD